MLQTHRLKEICVISYGWASCSNVGFNTSSSLLFPTTLKAMAGPSTHIFRYLLHVEPTLCSGSHQDPKSWHTDAEISTLLKMLPAQEQDSTLRFFRVTDKARALGSRLLKHLAITRACGVPWQESIVSVHPVNGKPFYEARSVNKITLEFNVSHDDDIVVLAGVGGKERQIGIDVMNTKRARDQNAWREHGGWEGWINTFEAALHPNEMKAMREFQPSGTDDTIRLQKLRLFYCYWVLKEAYIKMTGEAFLDPHIKQLEFRGVKVPKPPSKNLDTGDSSPWGEIIKDFEVWKHGLHLKNVYMELQALGSDYVVATAISKPKDLIEQNFPPVEVIDLQHDVVERYETWPT